MRSISCISGEVAHRLPFLSVRAPSRIWIVAPLVVWSVVLGTVVGQGRPPSAAGALTSTATSEHSGGVSPRLEAFRVGFVPHRNRDQGLFED